MFAFTANHQALLAGQDAALLQTTLPCMHGCDMSSLAWHFVCAAAGMCAANSMQGAR